MHRMGLRTPAPAPPVLLAFPAIVAAGGKPVILCAGQQLQLRAPHPAHVCAMLLRHFAGAFAGGKKTEFLGER